MCNDCVYLRLWIFIEPDLISTSLFSSFPLSSRRTECASYFEEEKILHDMQGHGSRSHCSNEVGSGLFRLEFY